MLNNADIILPFIINYPKYGCKYTKKLLQKRISRIIFLVEKCGSGVYF